MVKKHRTVPRTFASSLNTILVEKFPAQRDSPRSPKDGGHFGRHALSRGVLIINLAATPLSERRRSDVPPFNARDHLTAVLGLERREREEGRREGGNERKLL